MQNRLLLLFAASALTSVTGCSEETGAVQLEVRVADLSGNLRGHELDGQNVETVGGELLDNEGHFVIEMDDGSSIDLSACPIGDLQENPYGGVEGDFMGGDIGEGPFDEDAPPPAFIPVESRGHESSSSCRFSDLQLCDGSGCGANLAPSIEVRDEADWRVLRATDESSRDSLHLELRFRTL